MNNKLPALEGMTSSKIVAENLNAMHNARQAFIKAEADEKLRRALRHQVRTSSEVKFITGDKVYYKRRSDDTWKGPAVVIGQESQQVLIKHGSTYQRMHPCRLKLKNEPMNYKETEVENSTNENRDNVKSVNNGDDIRVPNDETELDANDESLRTVTTTEDISQDTMMHSNDEQTGTEDNLKEYDDTTMPKIKENVCFIRKGSKDWEQATIHSRAGKRTGKYKSWLNIVNENGQLENIDWNSIDTWKKTDESENAVYFTRLLTTENYSAKEVIEAKEREINSWRSNNVYEEVDYKGQKVISTKWIYSEKTIENKQVLKARLVARGFEESHNENNDSPTCNKETLRIMLTILLSNHWNCNSIDIKSAFLQGKEIEREVYLSPPKEYTNEGKVWLLKKTVYGLNDAPKHWYLRVREELKKLKVTVSKYDAGLFFYHIKGDLHGILVTHVDDFLWGGSHKFVENVIKTLHNVFIVGTVNKYAFKYLGLNLKEKESSIDISQKEYIEQIQPMTYEKSKTKHDKLDQIEVRNLRTLIGQLNWIATQTRPDLLYECCDLLGKIKYATIEDAKRANKVLKKLKEENISVKVNTIESFVDTKLLVFHDASFANMAGSGSQGGYVIFLSDVFANKVTPIAWQSHRLKRVVNSTIGAETMALIEASGKAYWLRCMISEIVPSFSVPIHCFTDSKTLYHAIKSTKQITDKRLSIDLAMIKEKLESKEIDHINWISNENQLADCLTKRGANCEKLLATLRSAKLLF